MCIKLHVFKCLPLNSRRQYSKVEEVIMQSVKLIRIFQCCSREISN